MAVFSLKTWYRIQCNDFPARPLIISQTQPKRIIVNDISIVLKKNSWVPLRENSDPRTFCTGGRATSGASSSSNSSEFGVTTAAARRKTTAHRFSVFLVLRTQQQSFRTLDEDDVKDKTRFCFLEHFFSFFESVILCGSNPGRRSLQDLCSSNPGRGNLQDLCGSNPGRRLTKEKAK